MKKEIIYKLLKSSSPDDIRLGMEFACKYLTISELLYLVGKHFHYKGVKLPCYFNIHPNRIFYFNGHEFRTMHFIHPMFPFYENIDPENTRLNNKNLQI